MLVHRANQFPDKPLFKSFEHNSEIITSYSVFYQTALLNAHELCKLESGVFDTVLLLFNDSVQFITGFFACLFAGKIPVPMFYPKNERHLERFKAVLEDSGCKLLLCADKDLMRFKKSELLLEYGILPLAIKQKPTSNAPLDPPAIKQNSIAFIQYTSGSTGVPKGVVISQENLLSNLQLIQKEFNCSEDSVILTWLPFYHDMGLIGNLLNTVFSGATCIIQSSAEAIFSPFKWLSLIHRFGVTHSGGPNFIYDRCIETISTEQCNMLDLSSWKIAYNGSEPIRKKTMEKFADKFHSCGFSPNSLHTCYGLAEATLMVTVGKFSDSMPSDEVFCGKVCEGYKLLFYNAQTNTFSNNGEGEICLWGSSVTSGYFRKDSREFFIEYGGLSYLRTGDVGKLVNGELVISGRLREILILDGKNIYPYDLETDLAQNFPELETNGVIVANNSQSDKSILVFAEIKRSALQKDMTGIIQHIDGYFIRELGISPIDIVLVTPRKLPRTSSGKLQRVKAVKNYQVLASESLATKKSSGPTEIEKNHSFSIETLLDDQQLRHYLVSMLTNKLKLPAGSISLNSELSLLELGVSSIIAMELVHQINTDLGIGLEINKLIELNNLDTICAFLTNALWLKQEGVSTNSDNQLKI